MDFSEVKLNIIKQHMYSAARNIVRDVDELILLRDGRRLDMAIIWKSYAPS